MEKNAISFALGCIPALLSSVGTEQTMNIILLVLGVVSASISVVMSIVSMVTKFLAWRKEAKADGIITEAEINSFMHSVEPEVKDIKSQVDKIAEQAKEKNK